MGHPSDLTSLPSYARIIILASIIHLFANVASPSVFRFAHLQRRKLITLLEMSSFIMDGHQQGLFGQFVTSAATANGDDDDDDEGDWLNAHFSDPDGNNNTDNDNFSELEDYAVHDDDEGLLEATRLHQVGYYDQDGMPYGRVYTKESVGQQRATGWFDDDSNAEDADDEGDAQNTILSAMDAFHLFTMRKRVQEANERWNSDEHCGHHDAPREHKVQFAQLIQLYTIQNGTDDENDDAEPAKRRPPVAAVSFQALRDVSTSPDSVREVDEAMTLNDPAELTLLDPAESVPNDAVVVTEPVTTGEIGTQSTEEPKVSEPTEIHTNSSPSLNAHSSPVPEPQKIDHQPVNSSVISKPKIPPRKLCPKKSRQRPENQTKSEVQLPQRQRLPAKTGLSMPKSHPNSPPKRPVIKSEPNIAALKSDALKTSTRTVSLSIFPNFPHQQQQPSHNNASNNSNSHHQMNPILQSVLAPKTLSALTKSWTSNPPNVHMLRELKNQIVKHNIPRAQLQPLLSKRMLSIIFDTPAEKVLSDFMRDTASSKARNASSKPLLLPPAARLSKSEEQQNQSRKYSKVTKRSSSTGQQRVQSSSSSFKSESKWASKPELIVLPAAKAKATKNKQEIPATAAATTNTTQSSSSMISGSSLKVSSSSLGGSRKKKRAKKKAVGVSQSKLEMSFQSLSLSKDILRETTAEKELQGLRRTSSPPSNPVGIKVVKGQRKKQVKGRLLEPSWD